MRQYRESVISNVDKSETLELYEFFRRILALHDKIQGLCFNRCFVHFPLWRNYLNLFCVNSRVRKSSYSAVHLRWGQKSDWFALHHHCRHRRWHGRLPVQTGQSIWWGYSVPNGHGPSGLHYRLVSHLYNCIYNTMTMSLKDYKQLNSRIWSAKPSRLDFLVYMQGTKREEK